MAERSGGNFDPRNLRNERENWGRWRGERAVSEIVREFRE